MAEIVYLVIGYFVTYENYTALIIEKDFGVFFLLQNFKVPS